MSHCGIVAARRCKQTSGATLEAMCDRVSVREQLKVLFKAGMMSLQRHSVVKATWMNSGSVINAQER